MISISRILHSLHTVLLVHLCVDVILFYEVIELFDGRFL